MKTVASSRSTAATTAHRPMTKRERSRLLTETLTAMHNIMAEALEKMGGIDKGPFEFEDTADAECENEIRAQVDAGNGSAEFLQGGSIFVMVDDLLQGPAYRQKRLAARRAELKAWKARHRTKLNRKSAKLKAA